MVPDGTKDEVLEKLCESGKTFETVADLCEMSARNDPRLSNLLDAGVPVKIAACYPRAVKWLFQSAGVPFPDDDSVEVLNMREETATEIAEKLLEPQNEERYQFFSGHSIRRKRLFNVGGFPTPNSSIFAAGSGVFCDESHRIGGGRAAFLCIRNSSGSGLGAIYRRHSGDFRRVWRDQYHDQIHIGYGNGRDPQPGR